MKNLFNSNISINKDTSLLNYLLKWIYCAIKVFHKHKNLKILFVFKLNSKIKLIYFDILKKKEAKSFLDIKQKSLLFLL